MYGLPIDMYDARGRHMFPDTNPGGKGKSTTIILLLEVGGNQALGGIQENDVLLLFTNPGATQVLVNILQFQYIHRLNKCHIQCFP